MDPVRLYTSRVNTYVRFVNLVCYPQGIRAYFRRSPHLRSGLRVLDAGCGSGIATLALRDALLSKGIVPGSLQAFDLTPAMLDRFRSKLQKRAIHNVCSGSMIPDTNVGGKIATINEVSDDQKATFFFS
ncbi:MAG: class I SAM-dependent methyltransferase [Marinobacter sp.]|nr:class I SAM-dependent methyltransferase [Marinobacter sp.]